MIKNKRFPFIEQVLCLNIIVIFIVAVIAFFSSNIKGSFELISMINKVIFSLLFKGEVFKIIIFIILILTLFVFIGYWITNIIIHHYILFGPLYLILFVFQMLFTEGYHLINVYIDTYYIASIFLSVTLLLSSFVSFFKYVRVITNEEDKDNGLER